MIMKMANLQKLMVIVALSWLTYGECQAQKLTKVSRGYFPIEGTYADYSKSLYWDANDDGKLEKLSTEEFKEYHFAENELPISKYGNGYYKTYFTEELFTQNGKNYVRIPYKGTEPEILDGIIPEKDYPNVVDENNYVITWDQKNGKWNSRLQATTPTEGLLKEVDMTQGEGLVHGYDKNIISGDDSQYFTYYLNQGSNSTGSITFKISPIDNLSFLPRYFEFSTCKYGDEASKFSIVAVADGKEMVLASDITPPNNSRAPYYSNCSYDLSEFRTCKNLFITITLEGSNYDNRIGFSNFKLTASLSGVNGGYADYIAENEYQLYMLLGTQKVQTERLVSYNNLNSEGIKEDSVYNAEKLYSSEYYYYYNTKNNNEVRISVNYFRHNNHLYIGFADYYNRDSLFRVPEHEVAIDTTMEVSFNGSNCVARLSLYEVRSQEHLNYLLYYPYWSHELKMINGTLYSTKIYYSQDYQYGFAWIDMNGEPVKIIDGIVGSVDSDNVQSYDFNMDGKPDFLLNNASIKQVTSVSKNGNQYKIESTTYNNYLIYLSSPERYTTIDASFFKDLKDALVIDINHDGKLDIFGYEKTSHSYNAGISMNGTATDSYVPVVYLLTGDGVFMREYLSVVTDPEELQDAMFSTGGDGSFNSYSSVPNGWMVKAPAFRIENSKNHDILDINNDGYPDILYTDGRAFLSLQDGRYYAAQVKGEFSICDLNSDGIKDIVTYDKNAQQVLLDMSQMDGTFKQTKLIENGSITGIYCNDMDGDGLVDILLQAVTREYSFLVFFKNKGDGTFKKTERALTGKYTFCKPLYLNNNGRPSILMAGERKGYIDGRWTSGDSNSINQIIWDSSFNIIENCLTYQADTLCIMTHLSEKLQPEAIVKDYDGDGNLDIMCCWKIGDDNVVHGLFSPDVTNTAPQKMNQPNVTYDKLSCRVRVSWEEGKDKENACGDLTYVVKAGTAIGAEDLLYYEAGRSSYCVMNVGTWPQGKVYISVCAIDASGMRGEWSEATSFENVIEAPEFLLSSNILTTTDTLVVTAYQNKNISYKAEPDGQLLSNAQGRAEMLFPTAGEKIITATVNDQITKSKNVRVVPFAFALGDEKIRLNRTAYFDLDFDGRNECMRPTRYDGKIHIFEDGKFVVHPSLFNADLSIGSVDIADKNMDGLPDLYGDFSKNGMKYTWMINNGELDFTLENGDVPRKYDDRYFADFNNDGYMDYCDRTGTYTDYNSCLYINNGNYTFSAVEVKGRILDIGDVDKDGNIDLLLSPHVDGYYGRDGVRIMRNMGNLVFEPVFTEKGSGLIKERGGAELKSLRCQFADVNNDGILDIIENSKSGKSVAVLLNDNIMWTAVVDVDGIPMQMDLSDEQLTCYYKHHTNRRDSLYWLKEKIKGIYEAHTNYGGYNSDALGFTHPFLTDLDNDSRPELCVKESSGLSLFQGAKNTAPTAPSNIIINQNDSMVVINWNAGSDQETQTHRLRYNLSVKIKGAEGDNSYVISPFNSTKDEAKTTDLGTMQYRYATRFPIPFSRFIAGKTYEVQVQTIDGWCEHSPFSKVIEFTPVAQVLFTMPEKAGVGQKVPFTLKDNSGDAADVNTDGGTIENNTIIWTTSGVKTVSITAAGVTTSRQILIVDKPDLTFSIPTKMLSGSMATITLPADFYRADAVTTLTINSKNASCVVNDGKGIVVMPSTAGNYNVTINYEDDVFGKLSETNTVEVVDFTPEISQVSVTSDGCLIQWAKDMGNEFASLLTDKVKIYRETSVAGKYDVIGETRLTDGKYMDRTARPDVKSCRYLLTVENNYGSESQSSRVHATILLMANHGLGNDINLHWNGYIGAQVATYRIYAGSSSDNLQQVDEVSGNTLSYIHHRSNDDATFYAIAYTLHTEQSNAALMHHAAIAEVPLSNIICSDEAYNVTMVQGISVYEKDGLNNLDENTKELHMQAIVTPALATLSRVEWSITAGNELAEIDQKGLLKICDNENGGIVTVQARAIDGSDVFGTMNISVSPYHPTDIRNTNLSYDIPIIGISNGRVYVNNVHNTTDVMILTVSGAVTYRNKIVSDTCIPLTKGIYIVKVGEKVRKVYIK